MIVKINAGMDFLNTLGKSFACNKPIDIVQEDYLRLSKTYNITVIQDDEIAYKPVNKSMDAPHLKTGKK
jgi:hypothetical protein